VNSLTRTIALGFVIALAARTTGRAQSTPPTQTYVADIGAAPLKAPLTADFSPGASFTMEGWFYLTARTPFAWLMGKGTPVAGGDPYLGFGLLLDPAGSQLTFSTSTGAPGSKRDVASPSAFPIHTWTHVAAVLDNGTMRLLINGAVVATGTAAGAPPAVQSVPLGIGIAYQEDGSTNFRSFPGYARQVRFWNVARTAAQIAAALAESLPTDRSGLVAAWPLDEPTGTAARDISGAGRSLTTSGIVAAQASVLAAGPFFATTTSTPVTLRFFNNSVLTDFDADGDKDLVAFDVAESTIPETPAPVFAYRNDAGVFVDVTASVLGNLTTVGATYPIVADFNGDGVQDLFVGDFGSDHIPWPGGLAKILIGTPNGRLVDESATRLPQRRLNTHSTTAADIDGDGDLDIFMGNISGAAPNGGPFVYLNDGHGHFSEATDRIPTDVANREANRVYTGSLLVDVDGDSFPDLVLGGTQNEVLMNDRSGHFVRDPRFALPPTLFSSVALTTSIGSADFNGDGKTDLLLSTSGGSHQMPDGSITVGYAAARLQLLLNRGDGTFTDATPTAGFTWSADEYWVVRPRIMDINGDGRPDIVPQVGLAPPRMTGLRIFLNRGNGQFVDASAAYRVPNDAGYVDVADFDRDGGMDLITVTQTAIAPARNIRPLGLDVFSLGNQPPAFTEQPDSRTIAAGASCTFMVAVSGYPLPTFQWRKDGIDIPGATRGTYTVANASPGAAGTYTVVATNTAGTATSAGAVLTVLAPPAQGYVAAIGTSPLKAPTTADFVPGESFTMEGWVYLPEISTAQAHLMGKTFDPANTDPYQSFALQLAPGNTLALAMSNGTPGSFRYLTHATTIPVRTWTHVAAVAGGGLIQIYINGVLGGTSPSPGAPPNQPTVPFALGLAYYANGSTNNGRFPGYARQVRFWNVARTADQLIAAMGETLPTDRTGLVAAWPLDESSGTIARDISGHGLNLTAVGGPITSSRTAIVDAQPFFAVSTTAISDGSLQYVNPVGTLIDVDRDGKMEAIEVQGGPATFPETRTRVRAYRLLNGAYADATDAILGTVTLVAPSRTLVADFNGDGWDDLLLAGIGTDAIPWPGEQSQLLLNDQHGHLVDATAASLPAHGGAYTHDAACGDIDGDGDLDLYMGNLNGGTPGPRIYVNDGTGRFADAPGRLPTDIENRTGTYTGCLLVDLTGDGRAELVLGGWPGGTGTTNEILLNNGSGTFARAGAPALPPKLFGMDGTVVGIKAADFNGDGRTDLLLSTTDHYLHAALQLLLRQADGSFADATAQMGVTWDTNVAEIDRSTSVLDLNDDGSPDIVAHFYSAADFSFHTRLLLNRSDATFVEATDLLPAGPIGTAFHTADVDGDGIVDSVSTAAPWVKYLRGLKPISLSYFYDAPTITTQPVAQVVVVGGSTIFAAAASGYPTPTFQWQKNGQNIPGATGSSFTIASPSLADTGAYSVVVTNAAGSIASDSAYLHVLTVAGAPYFTTQPANRIVPVGGSATFAATAQGTPAPTYQWRRDGADIPGATSSSYTIKSAVLADAGNYTVVAHNSFGDATSNAATLSVEFPPAITLQPASQTVVAGNSVTFTSAASGVPTPALQWRKGGAIIPGATSATLTIPSVQTADAGSYTLVATNPRGAATSEAALLTVHTPPWTTVQPQHRTVTAPGGTYFSVGPDGNPATFTYTWQRKRAGAAAWETAANDGPVFFGWRAQALNLSSTSTAMTGDRFRCIVSNGIPPDAISAEAVLTVDPAPGAPKITLQPVGASATASGEVILSVGVEQLAAIASAGRQADTPAYQWRRDGVAIPGATGSTYRIPSVQAFHAGTYSVVVTLGGQSSESNGAVVTVAAPPASDARLLNLSTRALCQTGDDVLIPGFYISGSGTRRLLMRAAGPELLAFGVGNALADPQMVLKRQGDGSVVATNDNWGDNTNWQEIRDTARALYAFGLTPGSKSAALLLDLPAGGYTIVSSGSGTETGVAIVELYEVPQPGSTTRLINISNRGFVGTGGNIMIPGFVVSEEGSRTFLIRAVGPTLARFNVQGTLADPVIEIYKRRPGTAIDDLVLTNDTWGENGDSTLIRQTASAVHAFSLNDGSADAALVVTLAPGAYTVNARGAAGATGVALVEVYLVP
jgi:hypothetical protein